MNFDRYFSPIFEPIYDPRNNFSLKKEEMTNREKRGEKKTSALAAWLLIVFVTCMGAESYCMLKMRDEREVCDTYLERVGRWW